jgi:hypothetical protein
MMARELDRGRSSSNVAHHDPKRVAGISTATRIS